MARKPLKKDEELQNIVRQAVKTGNPVEVTTLMREHRGSYPRWRAAVDAVAQAGTHNRPTRTPDAGVSMLPAAVEHLAGELTVRLAELHYNTVMEEQAKHDVVLEDFRRRMDVDLARAEAACEEAEVAYHREQERSSVLEHQLATITKERDELRRALDRQRIELAEQAEALRRLGRVVREVMRPSTDDASPRRDRAAGEAHAPATSALRAHGDSLAPKRRRGHARRQGKHRRDQRNRDKGRGRRS